MAAGLAPAQDNEEAGSVCCAGSWKLVSHGVRLSVMWQSAAAGVGCRRSLRDRCADSGTRPAPLDAAAPSVTDARRCWLDLPRFRGELRAWDQSSCWGVILSSSFVAFFGSAPGGAILPFSNRGSFFKPFFQQTALCSTRRRRGRSVGTPFAPTASGRRGAQERSRDATACGARVSARPLTAPSTAAALCGM
jgi:hypothetical protein